MNIGIARSNHFLQLSYVYSVSIVFTCYYALDSAVTVKSILVNLNIAAFKADASCASACTSDGLNTLQGSIHRQAVFVNYQVLLAFLQLHRNCIFVSLINSNTITCGIGSVCSTYYIIFINIYISTCSVYFIVNSIINTINLNACNCVLRTVYLYLRTGSKGFSFRICSIRNLNKSIFAVSTATAGNGNSTINCITAISYQADNCRIVTFSQSNFFNNVFIQIRDILIYHSQITVILANRIGFHSSTGICNASCPITIELTIILYCHKNFIILAINSAGINLAAVIIGKHAQLAVNNIHVSIIYSFSFISIGLLSLIPFQSRTCSCKAFRHIVVN